ncbi:MAG TPA: POTRA domain-containing protein, partial [Candidatus Acidoferrum sp.]
MDSADPANVKQESSSKPQESSSQPQPAAQQPAPDQSQQPSQQPTQQPTPAPTQSPLENAPTQAAPAADQNSPALVDRIIFIGNRRIRSDTLKARIFSREGDPYNEETLRRDFQALWNTQFFEDVKLRVEDSPDGPNHKNIIFEVKERPVIRRIRYEGTHSVSESDILDRFKERKVGLTVES